MVPAISSLILDVFSHLTYTSCNGNTQVDQADFPTYKVLKHISVHECNGPLVLTIQPAFCFDSVINKDYTTSVCEFCARLLLLHCSIIVDEHKRSRHPRSQLKPDSGQLRSVSTAFTRCFRSGASFEDGHRWRLV